MICSAGVSPASSLGEIRYKYDNIDRKTRVDYPNGAFTTYAYEPLTGWLDVITHYDASNAVILRLDYERDLTGLITAVDENRRGEITSWDYSYDNLKRLKSAVQTAQNGTQLRAYAYKYDRNGNRLEKSTTIGPAGTAPTVYAYSHNRLDQLRTERENGALHRTYEWDAIGRLSRELTSTGAVDRAYAWSVDDRLQGVQLPNNQTITYDYDHRGSRVSRAETSSGLTTRRQYLADYENLTNYSQILAETDAAGTYLHRNYVFGQDHAAHFQGGSDPGSPAFLHGDNLGTTRDLTSSEGQAIANASFTYTPFGDPTSGDSSLTNYRFTGQYREGATGLQWHRARWLDPSLNVFNTIDPATDRLNFRQQYSGLRGNPLSILDLDGKLTLVESILVGAIGLIIIGISQGIKSYRRGQGYWTGFGATIFTSLAVIAIIVAVAPFYPLVALFLLGLALGSSLALSAEEAAQAYKKGDSLEFWLTIMELFVLVGTLGITAGAKGAPRITPGEARPALVEAMPALKTGISEANMRFGPGEFTQRAGLKSNKLDGPEVFDDPGTIKMIVNEDVYPVRTEDGLPAEGLYRYVLLLLDDGTQVMLLRNTNRQGNHSGMTNHGRAGTVLEAGDVNLSAGEPVPFDNYYRFDYPTVDPLAQVSDFSGHFRPGNRATDPLVNGDAGISLSPLEARAIRGGWALRAFESLSNSNSKPQMDYSSPVGD